MAFWVLFEPRVPVNPKIFWYRFKNPTFDKKFVVNVSEAILRLCFSCKNWCNPFPQLVKAWAQPLFEFIGWI